MNIESGGLTNWEARGDGMMLGEVTLCRASETNKSLYQKQAGTIGTHVLLEQGGTIHDVE